MNLNRKEVEYVHVVAVAFKNEDNKLELGVWGYRKAEDAQRRFERIMAQHEKYQAINQESPLASTETFIVGIFDNFEESVMLEVAPGEGIEN